MFLKLFHLSVAALNSYAIYYDQMYVDLPFPSKEIGQMPLKARHMFLTVWCLMLQIIYFSVSFLNDIYGTNAPAFKKPPIIRRIKDVLFSLSFTVALYVSMVFWVIYALNKDFIFPTEIEELIPGWVNHVMHTLIAPFIVIELIVTKRNYPSRRFGVTTLIVFISTYMLWVNYIYFKTGVWVYPFLDLLNWTLKFVFFVTSSCIGVAFYVLGEKLNSLVSFNDKVYTNGVNGDMKKR